jgi:alkylation response protein AidB-like acyl-CoA dehydrogenase
LNASPNGGMTEEIAELRRRFREFIDGEVIPAEPVLYTENPVKGPTFERLKKEAKRRGLWAIGHPKEIGGGGLPFMPFVFLNEIVGRSHWGQICVGTATMQDSIMLHRYASRGAERALLEPLVAGEIYPSVGLTEPEVAGSDPTLMQATAGSTATSG